MISFDSILTEDTLIEYGGTSVDANWPWPGIIESHEVGSAP